MFSLQIVIEIELEDFAKKSKLLSFFKPVKALQWQEVFLNTPLEKIKPFPNSHFININQLDQQALKFIISRIQVKYDDMSLSRLLGGLIIQHHDQEIFPMCCGDLESIDEFQEILEQNNGQWQMFWIGHPWIFVRKRDGQIQFSEYCEENELPKDTQPVISIDQALFHRTFSQIYQKFAELKTMCLK